MFTFFIYLLDWLVQKQVLKLKSFSKFEVENTSEALSVVMLLINCKTNKGLRKFLKAHCDEETLVVVDSKLGNAIKQKLQAFQNILLHQSTTQNVCCHQVQSYID
ncbi:probable nucleolar protein 5-2 isoform X4 [Solanum stenotomum]|uniref:probable nucleolar protein 5-2 isoform X4 n=1 Tax=Solanum stenotomum TaxID=172797 RepID=UPI0020D03B5C|nr:probable nucleolar protein 5-2 isoform X4 [Solanum stenotomum]